MIGISTCSGGRALVDEHGAGVDESGAHGGFGREAQELARAMGGAPSSTLGEQYTGPMQRSSFSPCVVTARLRS